MSWDFSSPTVLPDNRVAILNRGSSVDVVSTAAETSVFAPSVAGGLMSTNRMLRATIIGDFLYNNAITDTVTFKVKFGGTTFMADTIGNSTSALTGAVRFPWKLVVEIANIGAANSQFINALLLMTGQQGGAYSSATTGIGFLSALETNANSRDQPAGGILGISTLGTIDTSLAQSLDVTAQWSTSSANNSWRARYSVLELV